MKFKSIPKQTKILSKGLPRYLKGNSDKAVMLIHGFTGLPYDMYYLGEQINKEGYTVSIPRLPGHGTNIEDFIVSSREQWLRQCVDRYLELNSSYSSVVVGGLSMGGVIAGIIASMFNPASLLLFAPAFKANNRLLPFSPLIRFFIKRLAIDPEDIDEQSDPELQYYSDQYWSHYYSSPVVDLYRLQKYARRRLSSVSCPTYLILSEKDNTVPLNIEQLLVKKLGNKLKETYILKESGHVLTRGDEKEKVAEKCIKWLSAI